MCLTHKKTCLPKRQGFTLIELLVVIAIIGLLSTLAVVALNNARSKSRDAKRVSDIKSIQTALELFFADKSTYPVTADFISLGTTGYTTLSYISAVSNVGFSDAPAGTVYMGKVPTNPTPAATIFATYSYDSKAGNNATACTTGNCKGYQIKFGLEETTGGFPGETLLYATPSGVSTIAPS